MHTRGSLCTNLVFAFLLLISNVAYAVDIIKLGTLIGHRGGVTSIVTIKTDGVQKAYSVDVAGDFFAWNVATLNAAPDWKHSFPNKRLNRVAVSKDGKFALVGGVKGLLVIFDLVEKKIFRTLPTNPQNEYTAVSPITEDGWFLAGTQNGKVEKWHAYADAPQHIWSGLSWPLRSVGFSQDLSLVIGAVGPQMRLWNNDTHDVAVRIKNPDSTNPDTFWIDHVSLSSDGPMYVSTHTKVRGFDANGNSFFSIVAHEQPLTTLEISTDGCCMVTSSRDNFIKVWDLAEQKLMASTNIFGLEVIVASGYNENYIVTAGISHAIYVWQVK